VWVSAGIVPGLGDLGRGSVRGRAAIATFLRGWPLSGARRARLVATHADGRAPIEALYRKYLSLTDRGWKAEVVVQSQPDGTSGPLPVIALSDGMLGS